MQNILAKRRISISPSPKYRAPDIQKRKRFGKGIIDKIEKN